MASLDLGTGLGIVAFFVVWLFILIAGKLWENKAEHAAIVRQRHDLSELQQLLEQKIGHVIFIEYECTSFEARDLINRGILVPTRPDHPSPTFSRGKQGQWYYIPAWVQEIRKTIQEENSSDVDA